MTESKKDAQGASCYTLLHAATETCDRIKTLPQQHFQVTIENAIWARILRIHDVASNLRPKLMGLINRNSLRKVRQSVGGKTRASGELRTIFYFFFIFFFFYFSFLRKLSVEFQFVYYIGNSELYKSFEVEINC